nr:hypothetical protein [Enterobacter cancerogenus]
MLITPQSSLLSWDGKAFRKKFFPVTPDVCLERWRSRTCGEGSQTGEVLYPRDGSAGSRKTSKPQLPKLNV